MRGRPVRELAVRTVLLLAGLAIAHLGVSLFLESELGSDPFNVFIQGLSRGLPWPAWMSHGRVHLLVSLVIMAVLLVVARSYVRVGTVLCMALGGPIIDLWTAAVLDPLLPEEMALPLRVAMLAAGCVVLAFGMTVVIRSELGVGPNDLVALSISELNHLPFGPVRVAVDVCFALLGFLLGGVVGVGTIICAFLVGPFAQLFLPVSGRICNFFVKKFGTEHSGPRGD